MPACISFLRNGSRCRPWSGAPTRKQAGSPEALRHVHLPYRCRRARPSNDIRILRRPCRSGSSKRPAELTPPQPQRAVRSPPCRAQERMTEPYPLRQVLAHQNTAQRFYIKRRQPLFLQLRCCQDTIRKQPCSTTSPAGTGRTPQANSPRRGTGHARIYNGDSAGG